MSLTELLPLLQELSYSGKLHALQFLVLELAKEEGAFVTAEVSYPIWSPYESFLAAGGLLDMLERDRPSEPA